MSEKPKSKSELLLELNQKDLLLKIAQLENESLAKDVEITKLSAKKNQNDNDPTDFNSVARSLPKAPFINQCEKWNKKIHERKAILKSIEGTDDYERIEEYTRLIHRSKQELIKAFLDLQKNRYYMLNRKKMDEKEYTMYQKISNELLEKENIEPLPKDPK